MFAAVAQAEVVGEEQNQVGRGSGRPQHRPL